MANRHEIIPTLTSLFFLWVVPVNPMGLLVVNSTSMGGKVARSAPRFEQQIHTWEITGLSGHLQSIRCHPNPKDIIAQADLRAECWPQSHHHKQASPAWWSLFWDLWHRSKARSRKPKPCDGYCSAEWLLHEPLPASAEIWDFLLPDFSRGISQAGSKTFGLSPRVWCEPLYSSEIVIK